MMRPAILNVNPRNDTGKRKYLYAIRERKFEKVLDF